jgi:hypothetical protein
MIDRRSGRDRRASDRYKVTIDIEWESSTGRRPGTISDISINGCFVLGGGDATDGEAVTLYFPIGDDMVYDVIGTVENHVPDIGFALKFRDLTTVQRALIAKIVERSKQR